MESWDSHQKPRSPSPQPSPDLWCRPLQGRPAPHRWASRFRRPKARGDSRGRGCSEGCQLHAWLRFLRSVSEPGNAAAQGEKEGHLGKCHIRSHRSDLNSQPDAGADCPAFQGWTGR